MPNIDLSKHPQIFQDRPQQIWVVSQSTYGILGASTDEMSAHEIPEVVGDTTRLPVTVQGITLHRPSLQPIYGGPTLLEALWAEMDAIMARLMTGETTDDSCKIKGYHGVPAPYDDFQAPCEHWDNGDRYRAEELAWVIAIVTNAYNPSIDAVRAEALRRWKEEVSE